jgi:DNA-binding MarR family transcriptional regulator
MSVWVKIKVTEAMRNHLHDYTEEFYTEVIKKAKLSLSDIIVLFYVMKSKEKRSLRDIAKSRGIAHYNLHYTTVERAIGKLYKMGLLKRKHIYLGNTVYWFEGDHLKCRVVKSVVQQIC